MLMLVLPADEGQHIQTVGAVRQADHEHPARVVMLARVAARRIGTFFAPARYKQWPLQGLDMFATVPGFARSQGAATVRTGVEITLDNHALGFMKLAMQPVPGLLGHLTTSA